MKVGAIQPCYLPWRGYFDFIASVDLFVFLDDVQYTKRDWRNRNKIKVQQGTAWITVPVSYRNQAQLICQTPIDYSIPWQNRHVSMFRSAYGKAKFFDQALAVLDMINRCRYDDIGQLDIATTKCICNYLGIGTPLILSSQLNLQGTKTARLIDLVAKVGASAYLSGPSARSYLDFSAFADHGIGLAFKSYDYPVYPQLWGDFEGAVSVLDLIANCGPAARSLIRSRTPDVTVVP